MLQSLFARRLKLCHCTLLVAAVGRTPLTTRLVRSISVSGRQPTNKSAPSYGLLVAKWILCSRSATLCTRGTPSYCTSQPATVARVLVRRTCNLGEFGRRCRSGRERRQGGSTPISDTTGIYYCWELPRRSRGECGGGELLWLRMNMPPCDAQRSLTNSQLIKLSLQQPCQANHSLYCSLCCAPVFSLSLALAGSPER
jgi:hypothetical protein